LSDWARRTTQGWLLSIHAQPAARTSGITGLHGDALKVRVAGPPEKGRANAELIALLSNLLGVPRRSVSIAKGELSRRKLVLVAWPQADPTLLLASRVPRNGS
jgi:uncharacterized protein (TIGR00251 family)